MTLEETIKMVQDCPSSIFTTEDAINIIKGIDETYEEMSESDWKEFEDKVVSQIQEIAQGRAGDEVDIMEVELELDYDNTIQAKNIEFDTSQFVRRVKNILKNKL